MKHPFASSSARAAATLLCVVAACADPAEPSPAMTGGTAVGGTNPLPAGSGAPGTAGSGVAGFGGGGAAGAASSAGMGGAGTAGSGTAGGSGSDASSAGSGGESSIPPTFATVKLVLEGGGPIMPCAAAPCHGVNGVAPPDDPLELPPNDDAQLYTNLTTYVSKACHDTKLVEPGNPAQSALLTILQGPCGATPRMPYMCSEQDGSCIPDEYIAAIAQWIADGAPK